MTVAASDTLTLHTAAPSLGGYLYQIERALACLFDLQENEAVGIEVLDDVHIERDGQAVALVQVKYHVSKQADLTDGSADLWKPLGIWAEAIGNGTIDLAQVQHLLLVTTATPPPGSVAEVLAGGGSTEERARALLAVSRSTSGKLSKAFDAVHALSPDRLLLLIERLSLLSGSANLDSTLNELRARLRRCGFHTSHADDAVAHFRGWLWGRISSSIQKQEKTVIREAEFHEVNSRVRDRLTSTSLQARQHGVVVPDEELAGEEDRTYVRQLRLIEASSAVRRSIVSYLQARSERSGWIERGEILPDELESFDAELIDRWRPGWEDARGEVQSEAAAGTPVDGDKARTIGRSVLRSAEERIVEIKPGWVYKYITTGSYHALADDLRVGWHPFYHEHLSPGSTASERTEDG